MKIAVVGAGSSGLVTLKLLQDRFPEAELVCFEKSESIRGCWGDQRPDFISTSTKYTTQFSCFRQWGADLAAERDYSEFFRGAEFGDYLEGFAAEFGLRRHIQFGTELRHLKEKENGWILRVVNRGVEESHSADAVFLCTGLVNEKASLGETSIPVAKDPEGIRNATVVVVGGGESAADVSNFLAKPEHGNTVYLSLRSGIRVSPRYHPIRGVPSDFLRNRLLLSFSKGPRNWVGERFVTFRIRFNRLLGRWFPHQNEGKTPSEQAEVRRREWDLKLKARAKGGLFNVFHNKSDDFLEAVGEQRLRIIGPAVDDSWTRYHDFDQVETVSVDPDVLVLSTGYRSKLGDFSEGVLHLKDFYHGCVHTGRNNLFLIGFARPIIGNIPSISEMQARYAVGVLDGTVSLPDNLESIQGRAWEALCTEYATIDTANVYPVEHYPYTDILARELGIMPTIRSTGAFGTWVKVMLAPASTTHYVDVDFDAEGMRQQAIYTPGTLVFLMLVLRGVGLPIRWARKMFRP